MPRINSVAELEEVRKSILSKRDATKPCITLCSGSACHATGSEKVAGMVRAELEKQGLADQVDFRRTGCHGFCEKGPIVVIYPQGICYLKVKPEDFPEIISETIKGGRIIGLDEALAMLRVAKEQKEKEPIPGFVPVAGNAEAFPFRANALDRIFTAFAFHHFGRPALIVREAHRVLKRGGRLALSEPSCLSLSTPSS